jgi:hypothetical protein
MKRYVVFLWALILCGFFSNVRSASFSREFSLRISGGYGSYPVGDLNTLFGDTVTYYDALFSPYDFVREGNYQDIKHFWKISAELYATFFKNFGLSFGIGYNQINRGGSVQWASPVYNTLTYAYPARVNILPVKLSAFVIFPLAERFKTYAKGGIGLYFAQGEFGHLETSEIPGEEATFENRFNADGKAWGVHGGLGLEYDLFPGMSVFVEGIGRSARIGNCSGAMTVWGYFRYPVGNRDEAGKMWHFEYWDENSSRYLSGMAFGSEPSGDERLRLVRELRMRLSGFSVSVGFKIHLGIWE